MLRNLTIGRYLCFHKNRRRNLNVYFRESFFLLKGNSATSLIIEIMIEKNLKGLERMEVLITSHEKFFLGNKNHSYGSRRISPGENCPQP